MNKGPDPQYQGSGLDWELWGKTTQNQYAKLQRLKTKKASRKL